MASSISCHPRGLGSSSKQARLRTHTLTLPVTARHPPRSKQARLRTATGIQYWGSIKGSKQARLRTYWSLLAARFTCSTGSKQARLRKFPPGTRVWIRSSKQARLRTPVASIEPSFLHATTSSKQARLRSKTKRDYFGFITRRVQNKQD